MDLARGGGARLALGSTLGLSAIACAAALVHSWPLAWPLVAVLRIARSAALLAYAIVPLFALGAATARGAFRDLWETAPGWRAFLAWAAGWALVVAVGSALLAAGLYDEAVWSVGAALVNMCLVLWLAHRRWQPLRTLATRFDSGWACGRRFCAQGGWSWALLGLLAMAFLAATGPPIARDEVTYHLVVPSLWQLQGGWALPTDNLHWLFPAASEVVWGYGLGVGGLHLPRLLTFAFGVMTVAMAWRWLTDEGFDPWTVRVSLVFLVAAPLTFVSLAMCNVEWALAFYLFLAWWASRKHLETLSRGSACVAGLAWGLALGIKYAAYPAVALLVVESIGRLLLRRRLRPALTVAAWFAAGSALFALPWLTRNQLLTGDPLYPLGGALGLTFAPAGSAGAPALALLDYMHLTGSWRWVPWLYHATADTVLDHRLHLGWPILLASVALFGWKLRASRPWLAAVGASFSLVAFSPAPRAYFSPLVLVWLFLPDFGARWATSRRLRAGASGLLALLVLTSLPASYLTTLGSSKPVQEYLLGITNENDALRQAGFLTPAVSWVRSEVPRTDRLWVWGDEQVFFLDHWARASSYLERPGFLTEFERLGPQGFSRLLKEEGIRFIVVNRENCPPPFTRVRSEGGQWALQPDREDAWQLWVQESLREVSRDAELIVFRVAI